MAKGITLTPCGLMIERIEPGPDALVIIARPTFDTAACPTCGQHSNSIHSRYQRSLSDLPSQGKLVRIKVQARRFRCLLMDCRQRIFAERLDVTVTRPFARRTAHRERRGWRGYFITSGSRWATGRGRALHGVSCSR